VPCSSAQGAFWLTWAHDRWKYIPRDIKYGQVRALLDNRTGEALEVALTAGAVRSVCARSSSSRITQITRIYWGRGIQYGSFVPILNHKGRDHQLFAIYTSGIVYRNKPPFSDEARRRDLLRRLNALPGVSLPEDALNRHPPIPLTALELEATFRQFLLIFD
jgi:hypothetical protein